MNIDYPDSAQIPQLRALWKTAFGDTDAFLDSFFRTAFSPLRCRRILREGQAAAALYWFDCSCGDQKFAYLYAIATHPDHRGQGLCRALLEDVRRILPARGYHGAVLVPDGDSLRAAYGRMGFVTCTCVRELHVAAGDSGVPLRQISAQAYARLRRKLLPPDAIVQEGENLRFLGAQARLLAGDDFLAAVSIQGSILHCHELLGSESAAPGIVRALNCKEGYLRMPGDTLPFAMYCPLQPHAQTPRYFGLAFD